jgi:hypothetical protein
VKRWYVWVIGPIAMFYALNLPMIVQPKTRLAQVVLGGIIAALVLGTIALANPQRFWWALRGLAALAVAAVAGYFLSEFTLWREGKPIGWPNQPDSSLWSAAAALLFFGVPTLRYVLTGRTLSDNPVAALAPSTVVTDPMAAPAWNAVVRPGGRYRVIEAFTDFDRQEHPVGEEWTFLRDSFLPYESGMTFFVSYDGKEESTIRLQWRQESQAHILDNLARYVVAIEP